MSCSIRNVFGPNLLAFGCRENNVGANSKAICYIMSPRNAVAVKKP